MLDPLHWCVRTPGPFFCQIFSSLYSFLEKKTQKSVVGYGNCKRGGKKEPQEQPPRWEHPPSRPSHPLQHLKDQQSSVPVPGIPRAGTQHTSLGDPALIPTLHPSIHQDNPIKSFTGRTWRWQQHIITNISSLYMVIIYSIFFYQCNTDRRLFYA